MFVYSNDRVAPVGRGVACLSANHHRCCAGEAELAALLANQRTPSWAQGEVSTRLPVWSVATMDAIPCFVVVLLFGTGILQTTGKSL